MATGADEFRAEAKRSAGLVIRRSFGTWSFCLSYGAVNPQEVARAAKEAGLRIHAPAGDVTHAVIDALEGVTPEQQAAAEEDMRGEWMLSAKPIPPNRMPTQKDMIFLGRTLVALHVPPGSDYEADSIGSRYWVWRDA